MMRTWINKCCKTDLGKNGDPLLCDPGGDEVHFIQHKHQVLVLLLLPYKIELFSKLLKYVKHK